MGHNRTFQHHQNYSFGRFMQHVLCWNVSPLGLSKPWSNCVSQAHPDKLIGETHNRHSENRNLDTNPMSLDFCGPYRYQPPISCSWWSLLEPCSTARTNPPLFQRCLDRATPYTVPVPGKTVGTLWVPW